MAKMFPGSVDYYKKSIPESELTVLETMEKSLPDDYMVFYSIAYINRKDSNNIPAHGEVDIIVLNKEKGMLFLEIKGGRRIFIEKGAFYSENHKGEINKIKDPFNQAKINMYSIKDIILKKNNFKWIDELPFCYGYGVIFPNGIFKSSAISFDEKMIIDHKGINSIKQKIDNIYDFWSGSKQMKSPLNKKEVDFLVRDVLFPEKDIIERISLEEMFAYDETKFINATIEQANVIKINTDFNKRLLIRGAAGTGKTVIALEIAKRNASMGKKVLLLCYNRLLGYYLFEETRKTENIRAGSFHGFIKHYCDETMVEFDAFEKSKEFWLNTAPELLIEALSRKSLFFDLIIIDEGQDFVCYNWWNAIEEMLHKDGSWFIFYDPKQLLFDRERESESFRFPFEGPNLILSYDLRNSRNIFREIKKAFNTECQCHSEIPDGQNVVFRQYEKPSEQKKIIEGILNKLLSEKINMSQIVLLGTHSLKENSRSSIKAGDFLGKYKVVPYDFKYQADTIRISNSWNFKGLESDIVIIFDIEDSAIDQKMLYVSMSRAKLLLILLHGKAFKPWNFEK